MTMDKYCLLITGYISSICSIVNRSMPGKRLLYSWTKRLLNSSLSLILAASFIIPLKSSKITPSFQEVAPLRFNPRSLSLDILCTYSANLYKPEKVFSTSVVASIGILTIPRGILGLNISIGEPAL